ncbi:uncharacterized protein EDB93DRAFT_1171072 [Suillus bovinus]|uniref:uncharacterized protein n=1 Tax=Suillus bovinus TaxID=48563 RepID=UPI001B87F6B8|nr:uncharacterized protein EDB93DRAFT_1171072 [Suillus bovinus]KAG2135396.1 hypothetical protein EDB93DRAFT_1171072 [Suillus bovinus]
MISITLYLFDHYSPSLATVSLSLYIVTLHLAPVIQPVFVRDIRLILSQLTDIVYRVIYNFGKQYLVLTSGMPMLLGITTLEFSTFVFVDFLLFKLTVVRTQSFSLQLPSNILMLVVLFEL